MQLYHVKNSLLMFTTDNAMAEVQVLVSSIISQELQWFVGYVRYVNFSPSSN